MESNIILYTTDSGNVSVQVQYENGTFWLTQKRMAEIFGVDVRTVNYHLKEIYKSQELTEAATIRKIRIVQNEGSREVERELDFYHLKAILAVGYRVNSDEASVGHPTRRFPHNGGALIADGLRQHYGPRSKNQSRRRIRGLQENPGSAVCF